MFLEKRQRSKRLTRQEKLFKTLLQQEKQGKKIRQAIHDLGWIPLEKPIFGGYERYFAIRPDLEATDNALTADLQKILKYVQQEERSSTKKFEKRMPRSRRLVPIEHELSRVSVKSFNKMDKKLQAYFTKIKSPSGSHYWNGFEWVGAYYYTPIRSWHFVSQTRKFYITEVREHDNLLLQAQSECEMSFLARHFFYHAKGKSSYNNSKNYYGGSNANNHQRTSWKNEAQAIINDCFEDRFF